MANYLDTGDTGRAVSAESDGALLAGIFGSAKYVLENGSQLKAEVQSNNIVKISDGDAVMYGRHVRIPANDSALVTINNGHSGTNRIDLIVFRYTKDSTGKEIVDLAVIQGEDSTGTAAEPATIDGDILTGAMQADFPLYRVELNGLNIVSVTAMFDVIGNISKITKTNKDLSNKVDELNKNIPRFYSNTTSLTYSNAKCMKGKAYVGEQFSGCFPQLTLLARKQQPYTQTNAVISDQVDSQGNVNILAYGSGYVNGHVLTVAVFVCK